MRLSGPLSLRARIALYLCALVALCWLVAAAATVRLLYREVTDVFDRDLRVTAERILPIVDHAYRERLEERESGDHSERELDRMQRTDDDVEFVIRSPLGEVLLRSKAAAGIDFPTVEGFQADDTWRFYVESAPRGGLQIAVARPLEARHALALAVMMALSLPLLVIIPLTLLGIVLLVRRGLAPIEALRAEMQHRGPGNLSPIAATEMPRELRPVVESTNTLLQRIEAGFEAERSFAANAAHEMRTPIAGAIAQAQRIKAESTDTEVTARADEIVATLKRLNRYSDKLMQLARAEGARLRLPATADLRPVALMIVDDVRRREGAPRIDLSLPECPLETDLDPDAFGLVLRNLLENALTHGAPGVPVSVRLSPDHWLSVSNAGPVVPASDLARLSERFSRGNGAGDGNGLGLSIVQIVAERSDSCFELHSPRPSMSDGVEAIFRF